MSLKGGNELLDIDDNILPYPKVFRSTMDGEEEEQ